MGGRGRLHGELAGALSRARDGSVQSYEPCNLGSPAWGETSPGWCRFFECYQRRLTSAAGLHPSDTFGNMPPGPKVRGRALKRAGPRSFGQRRRPARDPQPSCKMQHLGRLWTWSCICFAIHLAAAAASIGEEQNFLPGKKPVIYRHLPFPWETRLLVCQRHRELYQLDAVCGCPLRGCIKQWGRL